MCSRGERARRSGRNSIRLSGICDQTLSVLSRSVRYVSTRNSNPRMEPLLKRLLRLHVFVAEPFIEGMSALALDLRSHAHRAAAGLTRPCFGRHHQRAAHTLAARLLVDDETADLDMTIDFDEID